MNEDMQRKIGCSI